MRFFIEAAFILASISSSWGCDISSDELSTRLALLKGPQQLQSKFNWPYLIENEGISKGDFKRLIDNVKRVYIPIFKKSKMNLLLESKWEDNQTNAFAGIRGEDRYVIVYGGYARHKGMTADALLSVICHEIGHHLGGVPKKVNGSWSSAEGQADYFSGLKCMKEVLKTTDDIEARGRDLDLPATIKNECRYQFPKDIDYFICLRSAKAAEEYGKVLVDLSRNGGSLEVSLMTPSTEVVNSTYLLYPSAQCRVDTKYQGALCNVSTALSLDDEDEAKGTCHIRNFNALGNRPACWFVHQK